MKFMLLFYLVFYCLNDAVVGKKVLNDDYYKNNIGNVDIVHYQPEQVHLSFGGKYI